MTQIENKIMLKLKSSLPDTISVEVLERIANICMERESPYRLLHNDIKISYGESRHFVFHYEGKDYINVYTENEYPITWLFNKEGELMAT